MDKKKNEYEEPILLGAEDLEDVAGGCILLCFDGSCRPKEQKEISA